MEQYICIHGHFYQPPRENPWLEAIELQDSAYPYHDWNERITAECYAPNTASRILGKKGLIAQIVNNYTGISFNFGPTLLAWMEDNAPEVYQTIIKADRESQARFSGHGSALAQAYNHMILPLASQRDKYTQVLWGVRDFEHRFGRKPEGMWLPEAAVDLATLEVLVQLGIRFIILAPHQAQRVRTTGSSKWEDVDGRKIDTTTAYRLNLPSKQAISVFFYNEPIARAVAFEGLLNNGEQFASRLTGAFQKRSRAQLVHIATDGETYGHHHRYGDMALAYVLHYIESNNLAKITNYGEYLERHPPTQQVEIKENTSWSCVHGIERWRSNCGCNSGAHPEWNQNWRGPLREALDWLRDRVAPRYEETAKAFLKDPWAARDHYIEVVLDRASANVERFLSAQCRRSLSEAEKITTLKLLELERQAMLMYTSDGWFFDEISGIETVQIMQYAGRAIQLAEELFNESFEPPFLEILERAQSNIAELGDGHRVYDQFVKPAALDLPKIIAHFAISSLFEEQIGQTKICCYDIDANQYKSFTTANSRLAVGRARVTSEITRESANLSFGVLHLGNRKVSAGVREYQDEQSHQNMVQEITQAFSAANFVEVSRLLNKHFGTAAYNLSSLFRDEQRKVLENILESALVDIQTTYRQLYAQYYPPMRFLIALGKPNPLFQTFHGAAELILNLELRRALSSEIPDTEYINDILERVKSWKIELDTATLGYKFRQTLDKIAARFAATPGDLPLLTDLATAVSLARSLPFGVDLWQVQNLYYRLLPAVYPEFHEKAQMGDEAAVKWLNQFLALGSQLSIEVILPETA